MSKYTIELRHILETYAGYTEENAVFAEVNSVIQAAIPKVFDFDFPIFDENYRNVLETKILRHYYMREIGFETVGQWKLKLETTLNEIMPYYNQLYKSELLEFNPFYDVDLTREHKIEREGNENTDTSQNEETEEGTTSNVGSTSETATDTSNSDEASTSSATNNKMRQSDTPQGGISGLENDNYLTNATITDDTNNARTTSSGSSKGNSTTTTTEDSEIDRRISRNADGTTKRDTNSTENYLETVKGKQGGADYSELLTKYRNTFLNIDMQVINELNDLFFLLW